MIGSLLGAVSVGYAINDACAESLDEKFSAIRHNTPRLITVLNHFPKGTDLHNHATGAAYVENTLVFVVKDDCFYDLENLKIVKKKTPGGNFITVEELLKREDDLQDYRDIVSSRGWHENANNGSDHFFAVFGHIGSDAWYDQILARIISRNYEQGVRCIELMSGVVSSKLVQPFY